MNQPAAMKPLTAALARSIAALGLLASTRAPFAAQPTNDPRVTAALEILQRDNAWTLEQQVALCEIPAPPFKETARAAEYARRLRALGYRPTIDQIGNVIAVRRGTGGGRRLVLAAHLDTVFPEGTEVRVRREGTRLAGPGIGDDCRGLAVVLAVARAVELARVETSGDLVFVGNVGEEGPGNLRGVRHLFEAKSAGPIEAFISVDGIGLGLVSRAVGSNRYRVTFQGPGGHSYGDFGMPNPMHAMGRAIAAIADLQVPSTPRTIFNVGIVEGGTSVNSIAGTATMQVDLRSESAAALAALDSAFQRSVAAAVERERQRWPGSTAALEARIEVIGRRSTGTQPDSAWIVRAALDAATALGIPPPTPGAASTDANVPLGLGIPALAIDGGGRGAGAHSLGEWYDDGDRGYLGPQWALLLAVRVTSGR
jgi:acetylornithine deacetylase/succinyl-diaminopimelate desuccinylase-like protein